MALVPPVDDLALLHRLTMAFYAANALLAFLKSAFIGYTARVELTFAPRTWLVTLTDNPQSRFAASSKLVWILLISGKFNPSV